MHGWPPLPLRPPPPHFLGGRPPSPGREDALSPRGSREPPQRPPPPRLRRLKGPETRGKRNISIENPPLRERLSEVLSDLDNIFEAETLYYRLCAEDCAGLLHVSESPEETDPLKAIYHRLTRGRDLIEALRVYWEKGVSSGVDWTDLQYKVHSFLEGIDEIID